MINNWKDEEAAQFIKKYAPKWSEDLALRVYTSRLIGQNSVLVLHGGGNTSVKLKVKNKVGEEIDVIAVKGSGWDLSNIEPEGFPMVDLAHCHKLLKLDELSDSDMVNELRSHLMDSNSPNPSVETLLHALLPHKFVDHSHADSVLSIVDQPTPDLAVKVFGNQFAYVPYIMPGFKLAKKVYEIFQQNPKVQGLILLRHGLFTFGETAKESYDIHIATVSKAIEFIKSQTRISLTPVKDIKAPPYTTVVQILRGLYYTKSNGLYWVFHLNAETTALNFCNSEEVRSWSQRGPCTPDHVIRTKSIPMQILDWPVVDDPPTQDQIRQLTAYLSHALDQYITNYHNYFHRYNTPSKEKKKELDPLPRIIILRGLGIVSVGLQWPAVEVASEIYAHSIEIIQDAQTIGIYTPATEQDIWDMEYWSLEQAKLGKSIPKPLEGRITYITGAASGIGRAIANLFAKNGSNLYLVDINESLLKELKNRLKEMKLNVGIEIETVDVTSETQVENSLKRCVSTFGGLDIAVSNAGKPWQGLIGQSTTQLKESFQLNFFAHQYVAAAAVRIFLLQNVGSCFRNEETEKSNQQNDLRMGGCLLFNTSKASVNPGPGFGPYAVAKAATLALMKQYALEYGTHNIRSNAVNADRVRTSFFSPQVIAERAQSRNLTPEEYFRANLLKKEVTVEDVAQMFFTLALADKTSACTVTVDGGNIEASLR